MLYLLPEARIAYGMDNEASHIAHLLKKGAAEGFRKAATLFGPRIFALALDITGCRAEAEEVTSDTLMQVFRSISTFNPDKGSLAGWILRIAHNNAISAVRRRKDDYFAGEVPENIPAPEEGDKEEILLVREAIDRCTPQERTLIQLYYYDNLSLAEIAGITGVAAPTLAVRLQRLRQKIKQYILHHNGR